MKNKKVIIIIAVVVVMLLVGFTYWYLSKDKAAKPSASGSTDAAASAAHDQVVAPALTTLPPADFYGMKITPGLTYTKEEIYNARDVSYDSIYPIAAMGVYINSRGNGDNHAAAIAKETAYVNANPA